MPTKYYYDEETKSLIDYKVVDVEPIIEANKNDQGLIDGWTPSRDMRKAATIPLIIVEKWMREGVNIYDKNCWPEVRRRLNSNEYRYLRSAEWSV